MIWRIASSLPWMEGVSSAARERKLQAGLLGDGLHKFHAALRRRRPDRPEQDADLLSPFRLRTLFTVPESRADAGAQMRNPLRRCAEVLFDQTGKQLHAG